MSDDIIVSGRERQTFLETYLRQKKIVLEKNSS